MRNPFKKPQSTVALDIGTSMIKAVKMTMKGDRYRLEGFAVEPLEEGTIQSGEIRNHSNLAQAASRVVRHCAKNETQIVLALPNFSVLTEVLVMKLIPPKKLREAVMVEAERIYPFDLSEVEIDYEVLEQDEAAEEMRVLVVAAKQDIILSYINFLTEAGLKPSILDVDLFALTNIFHLNYDVDHYQSCILLDIGSESTIAAFLQNGVYHSSREISVSGMNFKKELQFIPDMSDVKAHDILQGRIAEESDLKPIVKHLNKVFDEFANAVGVAVSYFQASDNAEKIDLIAVTGGYARIPGLINVLELRTGAEVTMLDPFVNIDYDEEKMEAVKPSEIGTTLAVAMGLATRQY